MFLCKALDFNGFFYWHNHMLTHTHSSTIFGMKEKNQIYSMHSHNKIIKSYLRCFQTIFLQRCVCSFCFRPFAKLFSKYCFFFTEKMSWIWLGCAWEILCKFNMYIFFGVFTVTPLTLLLFMLRKFIRLSLQTTFSRLDGNLLLYFSCTDAYDVAIHDIRSVSTIKKNLIFGLMLKTNSN